MARVTEELCALLQVKQVRTSAYLLQTDGLVERLNKPLKTMLKKAIDKNGRNWDQILSYLLFTVRELPQPSTGFSSLDLLYSHKPRGLLDIAMENMGGATLSPSPHD